MKHFKATAASAATILSACSSPEHRGFIAKSIAAVKETIQTTSADIEFSILMKNTGKDILEIASIYVFILIPLIAIAFFISIKRDTGWFNTPLKFIGAFSFLLAHVGILALSDFDGKRVIGYIIENGFGFGFSQDLSRALLAIDFLSSIAFGVVLVVTGINYRKR